MKNKFRRGLLPLSALGAALVLVVSCGAQGAGYVAWDPEENPRDLEVTISWWNNYEEPDLSSTTEEASRQSSTYREYWWATDLIAEFNEVYPGITVEMEYMGGYSDIQSAVNSGLSGGNVPNIASCYGDHVAGYNNAGATLVMDEFMTDDYIGFGVTTDDEGNFVTDDTTLQSDMNETYLNAEKGMYASGQYLSLPYSKSSETLAVNLDVFNAEGAGPVREGLTIDSETGATANGYVVPVAGSSKEKYDIPTTWSELIAVARQMKEDFPDVFGGTGEVKKDSDGLYTAIPFVYDSNENMIISLLEMAEVDYTDGSGATNLDRVLFNNDDAKKIVIQLKEWYDEGLICTQDQLYYSDASSGYHQYSSTMQTQGTVFMSLSSTAGARYFITDDASFGFYETPTFTLDSLDDANGNEDTSKHKVISQGPSLTFFDKSDVKENWASWLFYKFLTNSNNSATLAVNTSYFPIRETSYQSDTVTALTDAAADYESKGFDTYVSEGGDIGNAYTGQVLNLNTTYTEDADYFQSDVFDESSGARTAIGDVINAVFAYDAGASLGTTEYETAVTNYVESQFTSALASAIGA